MTKRLAQQIDAVMKKIANRVAGFDHRIARVGVLDTDEKLQYEDGTNVAYVAAIHEFGDPASGIEKRPFFSPTIAEKKDEWKDRFKEGAKSVIREEMTADEVLTSVGATAAGDIRSTISSITSPPLKDATIMARLRKSAKYDKAKKRGRANQRAKIRMQVAEGLTTGIAKPLVDSSYLLGSIHNDVADEDA